MARRAPAAVVVLDGTNRGFMRLFAEAHVILGCHKIEQRADLEPQAFDKAKQTRHAGGGIDVKMELPIEIQIDFPVMDLDLEHLAIDLVEDRHVVLCQAVGSPLSRQALQHCPQVGDLAEPFGRQDGDDESPVWSDVDRPFGDQALQGVAHRHRTDVDHRARVRNEMV